MCEGFCLCEKNHAQYSEQCLFDHSRVIWKTEGSSQHHQTPTLMYHHIPFDSPSSISELIGRLFFMSGNLISVHDKVCWPCEDSLWINDLSVNKLCIMSAQVFHLSFTDDLPLRDGHFMRFSCVCGLSHFILLPISKMGTVLEILNQMICEIVP